MTELDPVRAIAARFSAAPGPPEDVQARVFAAIGAAPASRMSLRRRRVLALCLIPCCGAIVVLGRSALFDRRPLRIDLDSVPLGQLALELALLGGVTLAANAIATRSGRFGLGSAVAHLIAASVLVVPAFFVTEVLWPLRSEDPASIAAAARLHPWGLPCLVIAALIGVVALSALTWALRGAVPVASRLRGAALGAASGAWAGLALFIHCPATSATHLLLGHVVPVAVFTCLGALAVPRLLRP